MADLAPLTYGKIIGRFTAIVGDSADASSMPDAVPMTGAVVFTPLLDGPLRVVGATPPRIVVPTALTASLDANGDITDAQGVPGIWLTATDGPTDPQGWGYRVSFQLQYEGQDFPMPSFNIQVPAGSTQDLAVLVPLAGSGSYTYEEATINVTTNITNTSAPTVQVGTGPTPPIPFDDAGLYFRLVNGQYRAYLEDGS